MRNYFFCISLTICHLYNASAECCYAEKVVFVNLNKTNSCVDYSNAVEIATFDCDALAGIPNLCVTSVCGNGSPPGSYFCGIGDCNIFGCNCDFGCIQGDPRESVASKYGKDVFVVR